MKGGKRFESETYKMVSWRKFIRHDIRTGSSSLVNENG